MRLRYVEEKKTLFIVSYSIEQGPSNHFRWGLDISIFFIEVQKQIHIPYYYYKII